MFLRRKVNDFLAEWKNSANRMPLIIKGARQIGEIASIKRFEKENYDHIIEINFVL